MANDDRDRFMKHWDQFGGHVGKFCKDCEDRYPGCHGSCEKYLQAKKDYDEFKNVVYKNRSEDQLMYRQRAKAISKAIRKRKGK